TAASRRRQGEEGLRPRHRRRLGATCRARAGEAQEPEPTRAGRRRGSPAPWREWRGGARRGGAGGARPRRPRAARGRGRGGGHRGRAAAGAATMRATAATGAVAGTPAVAAGRPVDAGRMIAPAVDAGRRQGAGRKRGAAPESDSPGTGGQARDVVRVTPAPTPGHVRTVATASPPASVRAPTGRAAPVVAMPEPQARTVIRADRRERAEGARSRERARSGRAAPRAA